MEYAARLPNLPSRRAIVAPVVALVVGAGVATGAYSLIDDDSAVGASKVIVVEAPGSNAAAIPGKDEAATAVAVAPQDGLDLRGSKAAATGTSDQGISLRNP